MRLCSRSQLAGADYRVDRHIRILGDPGTNSDYHNVNPKILADKFNISYMGNEAEDTFMRGELFDWTNLNFPLCGIFAMLLGGGQTAGVLLTQGHGCLIS